MDGTAPTAAPGSAPAANANGWNRGDVTVTWHWSDAAGGAGLDTSRCPGSTTSSGQGEDLVVAATCYDRADNAGTASRTVDVDATAPGVTCSATPTFTLRGDHAVNVTATVSDALSKPLATTISADVTAADVAVPGPGSKSLTGEDLAGNQTTVACPTSCATRSSGSASRSRRARSRLARRSRSSSVSATPAGRRFPTRPLPRWPTACLVQVTLDGAIQGCATYDPVANTFQADVKTSKIDDGLGAHVIAIRVRVAGGAVVNTDGSPSRSRNEAVRRETCYTAVAICARLLVSVIRCQEPAMATMPEPVAELLDRALVGELTVIDANGRPVTYPLIPLWDGERVYLTSSTLFSKKLEHIDANAKVSALDHRPGRGRRTDRSRDDPGRRPGDRRRPARRLGAAPADLVGEGAGDHRVPQGAGRAAVVLRARPHRGHAATGPLLVRRISGERPES